jgi:hypothetical protein
MCVRACVRVRSSSLTFPACKSYAPLFDVICVLSGSTTFFYIITARFSRKDIEHKMCVLIFSTTFAKTFLIIRIIQLDIVINVKTFAFKVPVNLV